MTAAVEPLPDVIAVALDTATNTPDHLVVLRAVHWPHTLPGLVDELPLCWLADSMERHPDDTTAEIVDAWNVTFDQNEEALDHTATLQRELVSCPGCQEWMNA